MPAVQNDLVAARIAVRQLGTGLLRRLCGLRAWAYRQLHARLLRLHHGSVDRRLEPTEQVDAGRGGRGEAGGATRPDRPGRPGQATQRPRCCLRGAPTSRLGRESTTRPAVAPPHGPRGTEAKEAPVKVAGGGPPPPWQTHGAPGILLRGRLPGQEHARPPGAHIPPPLRIGEAGSAPPAAAAPREPLCICEDGGAPPVPVPPSVPLFVPPPPDRSLVLIMMAIAEQD